MKFEAKWFRLGSFVLNAVAVKAVLITAAFFGGRYLDARFGTDPWLLMLCLMAAIGLGLWWIVVVTQRMVKKL